MVDWALKNNYLPTFYPFQIYGGPSPSLHAEETRNLFHQRQPGVDHRPGRYAEVGGAGYFGSAEQQHQSSASRTGQLRFYQVSVSSSFFELFFNF